jgi:hypothetical protein
MGGDPTNSRPKIRCRPLHEPTDHTVCPVPRHYLSDPFVGSHRSALGRDGHITEDQSVSQIGRALAEFTELLSQVTDFRLDPRTRMVRN